MAKIFEVGDVLPQGTIRITWPSLEDGYVASNIVIQTNSGSFNLVEEIDTDENFVDVNGSRVYDYGAWLTSYEDIDTSAWTLAKRTVSRVDSGMEVYYWEDLNAPQGFNITFEENGGTTQTDLTEQTALPDPLPTTTKAGYTFVAWYIDSALTTRAVAGATIEEDTTLYAKWHTLGSLFTEIANAIRSKDGTSENIRDVDFGERVKAIEVGGAEIPSTAGGSIFTGATIPLTYKDNTHDYENNYEYKSATHNITITGLDGRATITGNGTKNILVAFDVTSSTSSLKNFTITCVNGEQELTYKGLHAHYGETVTGILTFAYNNITHDGSEGVIDTNYRFVVSGSTALPVFSTETSLFYQSYSYQILNVLIGNFSNTSIPYNFMQYCFSFNQPLVIPESITTISGGFLGYCRSFNQPLVIPESVETIESFLAYCSSFNQPISFSPNGITLINSDFLKYCYSFNQPLVIPESVETIGQAFMQYCCSFNQPLVIPESVTSIYQQFMQNCWSFNQPLVIPNGVTYIPGNFLADCRSFNQPLVIPESVETIGNSFMSDCYCLSTIIYNASVYPTDNNSLSQNKNSKTAGTYGKGIVVYGTKRAELMMALPNRTSSPFRKLINGGS